jgi:hypothetical protein
MDLPMIWALSEERLQQRRRELLDHVKTSAIRAIELPDGYADEFPPDAETMAMLGRLIALEHDCCCRFLTFRISIEARNDVAILEVTGAPEAKSVIADFLGAAQ